MTSQQLEEKSQQLEQRVAVLEAELAHIKHLLLSKGSKRSPWWLEVVGSFEDDPTFDEAVHLGQEWRRLAE